VFQVPNF